MSWISKNFEKVALGGAVVVSLGMCYLGWSSYQNVASDFSHSLAGGGGNDTGIVNADRLPKALQSMKQNHPIDQGHDGDRGVDLFVGLPLYIKRDNPNQPVDLLKDADVHPPMTNQWLLQNHLDIGSADVAAQDQDGDGFSNLEEFQAKTDPNAQESHPDLLTKLTFVKDETLVWVVRPGYSDGDKFPYAYDDSMGRKFRVRAEEPVSPGDLFFAEGEMKGRFKHIGKEKKKVFNERVQSEEEVTFAVFEDQRANKKGKRYLVPEGLPEASKNKALQYDRSAVFALEALGQGGKEFKVDENTSFAIPPDSPKKDYTVKEVTKDSVTVETVDSQGARKVVTIRKGGHPEPNS